MLVQLGCDQLEGELRGPDRRNGHFAQEVRQRADVILVAVREDDGADAVGPVLEVPEVR